MVRRAEDACVDCGRRLLAGMEVVASLVLTGEGFRREDRCATCFEGLPERPFSFWRMKRDRAVRPGPRKLDLGYLTEFFRRLDGRDDPHSRRLGWIVGLLLLRKKVLELVDRKLDDQGNETLVLRQRRGERLFELSDPQLTDEAVATIHEDLTRVFNIDEPGEEAAPGGDAT